MPEPKVQRLLRSAPIASRRRCPLKPWGPSGGNGRGPRRKYFRWGNLGGTRRRGLTTLQCQRTATCFKHGGGKPEWGSPQNACILWGPRVGGGNQDNQRDEKPIRSVFEHDAHSERVSFCTPPRSRRGKSPPKRASAGHKAIKARGGRPLRACFDFALLSLSRARKILQATPCKFFGAVP